MFILLLLLGENSVFALGDDFPHLEGTSAPAESIGTQYDANPIEEVIRLLQLETKENLRNIENLLGNSKRLMPFGMAEHLRVFQQVFVKQSDSLNQVMNMLSSRKNFRCGMKNQEYDEGRLLEETTCHCVPTPPVGTGLQVSRIVYDCRDTNSNYVVTCNDSDCSNDLWPKCTQGGNDRDENNEDDESDESNEDDTWQYVECEEISVPYLNTSVSCGAGWKSRGVKRLIGQGVFSQEEQLPCQECDQQLFQWTTWSTVGDKMVRHRGSNRIIDSYQEEERTVADPKVLLIGPGDKSYDSVGKSEVWSLPDLTPLDCNIPEFPDGKYWGYVGASTTDGVLMCGGRSGSSSSIISSCYLLTSSGYQDMPGLINKRADAASVMTPLGLWVTGGMNNKMNRLDSTELVTDNKSRPHVRLPQGVMGHCLININQTHYLLAGGLAGTGYDSKSKLSTAYLYSEESGFIRIEDMKTARRNHGCSVINNTTVLVTGGWAIADELMSSEFLDLTTMTWSAGPELLNLAIPARMVGNILIEDNKIYKLEEETIAQRKQWRWTELRDLKYGFNSSKQVFVVNQNLFCKN